MTDEAARQRHAGYWYGIAAYLLWGVFPLYFQLVLEVPRVQILAHRIVWSMLLLVGLNTLLSRWGDIVQVFRSRRTLAALGTSAFLIAFNWYFFIYAVTSGQALQASLGYFMLPLVNAACGIFIFKERLNRLQAVALGFAFAGVLLLTLWKGYFPWISIILAVSFTIYGVIRKQTPIDGMGGLTVESILLFPIALAALLFWNYRGELVFSFSDTKQASRIALSGLVTILPLIFFAQSVRKLPLLAVGFLQYIAPTIQLLIAIFVLNESFGIEMLVPFCLIWFGLGIFAYDAISHTPPPTTSPEAEIVGDFTAVPALPASDQTTMS